MSLLRRIVAEKRMAVVLVGLLVLGAALVHVIGVYPQRSALVSAQIRAATAAQDLRVGQTELAAVQARLSGKSQADGELEQFYSRILPQNLAGARAITYPRLAALADQMGLILERRTSDREQDDESELGRLRTTLSLSGSYPDIRRFVEVLETAPEFLVIDEVVLSQREAVENPDLVLTLGVSTYYRAGNGV